MVNRSSIRERTNREDRPQSRFAEIDALRGLAACSVVLWHSLLIFPWMEADTRSRGLTPLNALKYTPLRAFVSGPQAVMLFFAMSGFVLALPFFRDVRVGYTKFVARRFLRIWPAYALFCLVSFILARLVGGERVASGLSSWFAGKWHAPVTGGVVWQHLALVDDFRADRFNPVIWSLVHEMRISLVFPLIALFVARASWRLSLAVVVLWFSVVTALIPPQGNATSWFFTLQYVGYFIGGALLAKQRGPTIRFLSAAPLRPLAAAVLAVGMYTYPGWAPSELHGRSYVAESAAAAAGSFGILGLALAWPAFSRLLHTRSAQFAGRISYSLYLCHALAILLAFHLLYRRAPTIVVLGTAWVCAIGFAALSERFVERPSIALGRRLTSGRETLADPVRCKTSPQPEVIG